MKTSELVKKMLDAGANAEAVAIALMAVEEAVAETREAARDLAEIEARATRRTRGPRRVRDEGGRFADKPKVVAG